MISADAVEGGLGSEKSLKKSVLQGTCSPLQHTLGKCEIRPRDTLGDARAYPGGTIGEAMGGLHVQY